MIDCGGVWLPDGEQHMVEWMTRKDQRVDGKLTYQLDKQRASMGFCKSFRTAVDIGAHVGLWSVHLAQRFQMLHAFEPVEAHRHCWVLNVPFGNVCLYPCALGEYDSWVSINITPSSSGGSYVGGAGLIPMRRLDDFGDIEEVDFIKLDCEGYELFALKGGERLIRKWRPTICVEQKPGRAQRFGLGETDAVTWLEGLGASVRQVISGDYILSF